MDDKKNPDNIIANVANECTIEHGQVEEFQIVSRPYGKSTRRVMRPRHIQMMAISGAIGTGLFIGSGGALAFGGPDYVALTAGEAQNPRRVMPRVFSRVIYRLVIFYVLGVLCVGILVPYDDPALTSGAKGAGSSPFVIGVTRLGITGLPSLINAILITSAWSCGIEIFYAASRSAYAMALGGYAPSFLLTTWRGVPIYCVIGVWLVSLISFMTASNGALTVFTWITSIVGAGNLVIYFVFHITYIRFRRAQKAQGVTDEQRPWFRKHQYYYSYASAFLYGIIVLTNGFEVFIHGHWSISNFILAYFALALFVVALGGWKLIKRTRMRPLDKVDLMAGRCAEDWEDEVAEPEPNTRVGRFNRWLWG
ncbi:AAT family amino acid transporter, partial [Aureobasidium melanogenum]